MAGSKDTGTGGINIDGDLYTMDVFEPGSPEDSDGGKYGRWSPGDVSVDKSIKDISKPTKETFAKYLSNTTLGKPGTSVELPVRPNPYPVGRGDSTALSNVSLRDVDGNPIRPSISENENLFAPDFNRKIGEPSGAPLKKGYTTNDARKIPDGNQLLRNAAIPADSDTNSGYIKKAKDLSDPMKGYVSQVLKVNRFNPVDGNNGEFIPDYLSANSVKSVIDEKFESNSSFTSPDQLKLGSSLGNNDVVKREYGFGRLAKIAPILQKNATYLNRNGGDPSTTQENSNSSASGGNLESNGDLSLPIERLNIENIIKDLPKEILEPEQMTDFGSKFETTLNNLVDKFSGLSNESQIAVAAALISATFKAYQVVDQQVGNAYVPAGKTGRYRGVGRQGIGTYFGGKTEPGKLGDFINVLSDSSQSSRKLRYMNIKPTSRPFRDAVFRGMNAFFSVDNSKSNITITRPVENVSYSIVLARSIIRSSAQISLLIKEVNDSKNLNGEEKAFEIVKVIRDSRLIGIFNFFAHLGDIGLDNSVDSKPFFDVSDDIDNGRKISMIDSLEFKHGKNRLFQGKVRKLAWSVNQTPDILLSSPFNYYNLAKDLNGPTNLLPSADKDPTAVTRMVMMGPDVNSELSRIPDATRAAYERSFDSEYVPFYFHDVRTNEIVGFHAFITSLSEDYAAAYDSVEGFGRIEPVKVYKNTQRKISISFIAAALDEKDFDAMWYKINKLTTMVYPQYTPGKRISNESFSLIKPFTQAIGAAPMIRLRLGNLITSNYSKFNLSKIFGLHENDTVLNGIDRAGTVAKAKKLEEFTATKNAQLQDDLKVAQGKLDEQKEAEKKEIEKGDYKYLPDFAWYIIEDATVAALVRPIVIGPEEPDLSQSLTAYREVPQEEFLFVDKKDPEKDSDYFYNPSQYLLAITLEHVVTNISNFPVDDPNNSFSEDNLQINSEPIDPKRTYDDDTLFVGTIRKVDPKIEYLNKGMILKDSEGQSLSEQQAIERAESESYQSEYDKQAEYDKLASEGKLPDIYSHRFIIQKSALKKLTWESQKRYETYLQKIMYPNVDSKYQLAAEDAAEQQTVELEDARKQYEEDLKNDPTDYATLYSQQAVTFMDPRNNTIVRSFRSAGGQGLAGFIESMQFDWMAGTWDTSDERKAPKMCKITMSFTPTHDIPPGLSSDGQNRAPIYQLGVQRSGIPGV